MAVIEITYSRYSLWDEDPSTSMKLEQNVVSSYYC